MILSQENKEKKEVLVLLDSHAILHRAFHALPNFTSPSGEPTGALYGFSAFLLKIVREINPDYIAACYDLPEPTFRHIAYEQYKIKRPKMDDVLAKQINRSRDILKAFHIPIFAIPGFEADDMLGSIVSQLKQNSDSSISIPKVIIASGDLDTLQLVRDDDVVVYTLSKGIKESVIYNEEEVYKRYGFGPQLIPDFKALRGDPSDNIIGVKGIGEKTAIDLIKKFGSLENIYKVLKEDEEKIKEAGFKERIINLLKEYEEDAFFSKTLAEIRGDAPISFSLKECKWSGDTDRVAVEKIFNELGFKSLITRMNTLL